MYQGNRNNTGNRNTNINETIPDTADATINRTNNRPKCTVCPLLSNAKADWWELDKKKSKRPDNWSTLLVWHTLGSIYSKEPGISGIINNNIQNVKHYTDFPTFNDWTPLDSQVKNLGSPHEHETHKYVTPSLGDSNSAVFRTGITCRWGRRGNKFQPTTHRSHKIFHMPTSETTAPSI